MAVLWIIIFIVALAILIFSAEKFTESAEKLGLYFGLPSFVVGITIVSIGTSLPELAAGVIATLSGSSEIVIGNVVGSNISNIFLVLGLSALVASWKQPLKFTFNFNSVDMPLFIFSTFLLAVSIFDGIFGLAEAIICFLAYIIYIIYSIKSSKKHVKKHAKKTTKHNSPFPTKQFIFVLISGLFIYLGAQYTVQAILEISVQFGIGSEIIALSAVALGTSLPELSVSLVAARKRNFELALGNVLGSNVFNTFMVMAIPGFIKDLFIPPSIITFHLPLMIGGSLLLFLMMLNKKMTKWKGLFLLVFYLFFLLEILL